MGMGWRNKPFPFSVAQASARTPWTFSGYLVLVYKERKTSEPCQRSDFKKHDGSVCEVLTSFRDRSPVDDRAFPLSAEVQNTVLAVFQPQRQTRREEKPPWHQEHKRRRSSQAAGQDRTARSTRHKRQQAVNGWQPKCFKSTRDDDSSLSCGRNHGVS